MTLEKQVEELVYNLQLSIPEEEILKKALIIAEKRERNCIIDLFYEVDVEKEPSIQDEAWANQYESKVEAFWRGQAQYRKDVLQAITNKNETE